MKCTDSRLRELLFDYVDGALSGDLLREITDHVGECSECSLLADEYGQTAADLKVMFRQASSRHIENELLVSFVETPRGLDQMQRSQVQLHIDLCDHCRNKVDMLGAVISEQRWGLWSSVQEIAGRMREVVFRPLTTHPRLAMVTAAIAVALVIGTLHLYGPDQGPLMDIGTTAEVVWLRELVRSGFDIPIIRERQGRIDVGVPFRAYFDEEAYRARLLSPSGQMLIEAEILPAHYNDPGARVRIRSSGLEPGKYQLLIVKSRLDDSSFVATATYPFELVKE
jgi:predicted anti-sigma-YlaC factor YlaD